MLVYPCLGKISKIELFFWVVTFIYIYLYRLLYIFIYKNVFMSEKILTVKEWAKKYVEWFNKENTKYEYPTITEEDIIGQINLYLNDDFIEKRLPTNKSLRDLDLHIDDGINYYKGNIFLINGDENKIASENDVTFSFVDYDHCEDEFECCVGANEGVDMGDEEYCENPGTDNDVTCEEPELGDDAACEIPELGDEATCEVPELDEDISM